ncbi:ABC transporter ATP-binding protein [Candidatus Pelagibacter communis]|uniref:ABC transporter ATP-binding protein n=1 Tax=Pelagibacter ubique TaxID=198252 RepID=UPI00094C9869|nr:ABC transporter ATP-binding protein [Candidatus Pelagibacter ubique]MDC3101320.1 ABC transporter ATP-binding protein [Candidatus Pelagibacter sp.]
MNTNLKISNVTKIYPGCVANDNVSLEFNSGKIYALLGENGAGKSTLVKILSGVIIPDEGKIYLNENNLKLNSPLDAKKNDIGMVFQHFNLFETLSVFENLIIDSDEQRESVREKIDAIMKKYNFSIDLDIPVLNLSAGQKQKVEIIRCLIRSPKVLIMDEPTSVLTEQETSELFLSLKKFSEEGILIIYITHKLKEVMQLCDEVAVMRRGKLVSVSEIKNENIESLANKMVGQNLKTIKKKKAKTSSDQLIKITNLNFTSEDPFETNLTDINFSVNRGECLGIAGISGNGQSELFQVLSGEIISEKNSIEFNNNYIGDLSPQERREYLMAFSPEDRLEQAAIPQMKIFENVALNNFKSSNFFNNGLINENKIKEHSKKIISDFNVNTDNIELKSQFLSGGNLQKLIIGRELITSPDLLICFNPTWGLDVGAINYIHETLIKINEQNKSIILISTDTDELLKLSDKISVIHKGKLSKIMNSEEVTSEKLGILMGGAN